MATASAVSGASPFADPSAPMAAVDGTVTPVSRSAVSWAAIIAGAVVASAVTALMFALGAGLGLSGAGMAHPGSEIATFSVWTGIWLIITQWVASCLGGYLAGRMRTRWHGTHEHEVFFRDTAHGLLTWSLATVMVAVIAVGAGALATGAATHPAADGAPRAAEAGPYAYQVDQLFRGAQSLDGVLAPDSRGEASRILAHATSRKLIPADDRSYLAVMVAHRTGLDAASAQTRVDLVLAQTREAADKARKAAAATAIITALAMLIGAFIASVSAVIGGRLRDEHI